MAKYRILEGGYGIDKKKPRSRGVREFKNTIEANKYCKKLGKGFWCEYEPSFQLDVQLRKLNLLIQELLSKKGGKENEQS